MPCKGHLPPAPLETGELSQAVIASLRFKNQTRVDDQGQGGQYHGLCSLWWGSFNLLLAQSPKKRAATLWAWKALEASLSKADVMLQCSTCTGARLWHNS